MGSSPTLRNDTLLSLSSADSTGTGRVYKVMKTQVSIKHDGSVNWFCPLILKSECSVKLYNFPFDRQSCPLIFGLWTLSQLEVNITLVRKTGDIGSYLKNGVFVLTGMPAYTSTKYYTCCPNVPYTRMIYTIKLQRKTTFYLFNFIFPGGLLIILSFLSYLLPPESGERMGLGITNVIAFLFYMMLINEKIPPVSIAVPIITEFLLIAIAINAVTLISSAFAVKMLFFEGDNLKSVPWTVRVLINKHLGGLLARLCLMCGRDTDCRTSVKVTRTTGGDFTDIELRDPRLINDSPDSQSSVRRRRASHSPSEEMAAAKSDPESRPVSNGFHVMKNQSGDMATGASKDHAVAGPTRGGVANGLHASQMPPDEIATTADKNPAVRGLFYGGRMSSVCAGLDNVVKKIRENEASSDYKAEWRTAIKIIDRSLCVVLMLFTFSTMLYLYLSIEKFLVV